MTRASISSVAFLLLLPFLLLAVRRRSSRAA
jgi:hypothetical protein